MEYNFYYKMIKQIEEYVMQSHILIRLKALMLHICISVYHILLRCITG
jgi:hypothetical protein